MTLAFAAATLLMAYPLSFHPASRIIPFGSDSDLNLWIFGWDVHALTNRPLALFDANIFHPYRHTLAYSENLIGSAWMVAPIVWLTGNLVLALNVSALLATTLCGTGTYYLARRLGLTPLGAIVAATVFTFSPPRFARLGQPHLIAVQWLPFCLAFLHGYFETGRRRDLLLACAFFTLQALTSGHGAAFALVAVVLLTLWRFLLGEPIRPVKRLRDLGVIGVLILAVNVGVLREYRAAQREVGLERTLVDSERYEPNLATFLTSPSQVDGRLVAWLAGWNVARASKAALFPGFLPLALGLVGAASAFRRSPGRPAFPPARPWTRATWAVDLAAAVALALAVAATLFGPLRVRYDSVTLLSVRTAGRAWLTCAAFFGLRLALVPWVPLDAAGRWSRLRQRAAAWAPDRRADPVTFYLVLAFFSLWLALGPSFKLYALLHNWPGFGFIRVTSRFTTVTLLALAVLSGFGMERLVRHIRDAATHVKWLVAGAVNAALLAEFAVVPILTLPFAISIPPVDRWLATQPKPFAVVEMPVRDRLHSVYMLHSMAHWQPTVHGYSGIRPKLHDDLYQRLATFPDLEGLRELAALGVTYVVVHPDYYSADDWAVMDRRLANFSRWLTLVHSDESGRVYRINPSAELEPTRQHLE